MYLKKIKSKNLVYLKIVSSYREDGKVKHRVIANLGRLDQLQSDGFGSVIDGLHKLFKSDKYVDITTINEQGCDSLNYGWIFYKKIWDSYNLDHFFDELSGESKIEFDLKSIIFSLVINRTLHPTSKLKYYNHKDGFLQLNDELELQHIYRAMDVASRNKKEIENYLFTKSMHLFNRDISVAFYDVTTFYFESKTQDDLRDFGFSKDHKVNEVQVVMGLLIDAEGLPLGYELFRGNTFDSKTMISILKKLKDQFGIKHITIVADRGLNSKLNFKEIKESGFDYIVSAKIKTMPNETQEKIINGEGYTQIKQDRDKGYYGYKTMSYTNIVKYKDNGISHILELKENLICTYSDKRANKDKKDRLRLQQKAQELIDSNNKSSMNEQKGHKKYIKKVHQNSCDTFEMQLDLEKLKADEKYDGYYAIHTSNLSLNPLDVIQNYHNLYKIEDSFRVLKSTFKTRPIYHFKPSRIEGHFILCFLSFFLERHMEYQLKNNKKTKEQITDANNINDALQSINFIKTDIENKPYYLKSNHTKLASLMFDVFKIKQPKQLNTQNDIETYI